MDLISGDCKNCGAKIKFESNMKKGFCSHCGTEFIVQEAVNQTVQNINIQNAVLQSKEETYSESLLRQTRLAMQKHEYGQAREHLRLLLQAEPNNKEAQGLRDLIANIKYTILGNEVLLSKVEPVNQTFVYTAAKLLNLSNPQVKKSFFAVDTIQEFLLSQPKGNVKKYNEFQKETVEKFLRDTLQKKSPSNIEVVFTKLLFDAWAKSGCVAAVNKYNKRPEDLVGQHEFKQIYESELKELKKDKLWRSLLK